MADTPSDAAGFMSLYGAKPETPPADVAGFMQRYGRQQPFVAPDLMGTGANLDGPPGGFVDGIVKAFGSRAAEAYGPEPTGLSPESEKALREAGIFNDAESNHQSLIRTANEAILRPAARLADVVYRGAGALYVGAQGALVAAGVPRDIAAIPDAFMGGGVGGMPPHPMGRLAETIARDQRLGLVPREIIEAKSLGIVGDGVTQDADHLAAAAVSPPEIKPTEAAPPAAEPPAATVAPDIHAIAREVSPETFAGPQGYDAIVQQRDTFRRWLDELTVTRRENAEASAPHAAEIADLEGRLPDASPRLAKKYQARLDELTPQRDAYVAEQSAKDTPDMARIRAELQKADFAMRDLAPDVSAAYREAKTRMPEEPAVEPAAQVAPPSPAEAPPVAAEPVAATPEPAPPEATPAPAEPASAPVATGAQRQSIADDVAQRLTSAGRPAEESQAAAALIAAHYEARAARFEGRKGTAEELYRAEAPEIRAGRGAAVKAGELELAQPAYHGSPHIFDKFDTSRIGTGEGAQAYGHGLYFAGKKGVAEYYREALAKNNAAHDTFDGQRISRGLVEKLSQDADRDVANVFRWEVGKGHSPSGHNISGLLDRKIAELKTQAEVWRDRIAERKANPPLNATYSLRDYEDRLDGAEKRIAMIERVRSRIDKVPAKKGGRLYHVELAPKDEELLDWDKPYSEQSDHVKAALKSLGIEQKPNYLGLVRDPLGSSIYESEKLVPGDYRDAPVASKTLLSAGVRGIKYLDRGSRGAGEGSHNFVIFSHDDVAIKEYEQAKRGSIALREGRNVITLMKDADASTFMHETAHDWLEELQRDAKDERAPADLVKDMQTVRDWLGTKEGEAIARAQHEKFARGFERYLMEGIAPSKALAGVFAKFKDWLTKIYQTVQKLRSPINDDIRAVFDRLLATPDREPVVAPELAGTRSLPDIHAELAEKTQPAEADPVADRVRSEADAALLKKAPEVHDEIGGRATGEPPGNPPEGAQPDGDRAAGQPDPGPAGGGTAGGDVGPLGGQAAAEGGRVRAVSAADRDAARSAAASNPHEPFRGPDSPFIDKAGNIRLDKLNQPGHIDQVIRDAADRNADFIQERRGVITDGMALDLADAMGRDPAFLDLKKIGSAYSTEEIIAAKKLLIQSATAVRDAMTAAADGGEAELLSLAETIARHEMIQGKVAGATAEWGRAGRALNMVMQGTEEAKSVSAFLKENTGRDLNQLFQMAKLGKTLKTPQQVSRLISDTRWGKIRQGILTYYINALISGPVTHARYSVGNAINALERPLVEIPIAAAIGKVRELAGATPKDRVYLGEAGAQLMALMKGSQNGLSAAVEAFRTGISPALPGERVSPHFADQQAAAQQSSALARGLNVPSRSVAAIHSFFKGLRYEQNLHGLAYRTAMEEGLEGAARETRIAQIIQSPTDAMMEASTKDALKELYMAPTDYHSAMGALNRAVNSNLAAKIIIPFMKIGSEITRNAFAERTPLGLLDKEVRGNLVGREGGAAKDLQAAKMTVGVSLMGAMVLATLEGNATGDGPSDPDKRAVWLLNHRPNSITIGPITIPYQGLGHLGMLMRFAANMTETGQGWDSSDGEHLAKSYFSVFEGLSKSVLDENFMRGVKDMLDAVYHPQEYGANYVKNFVTNWLPFSVGLSQVARLADPFQRETHGIFEAAQAKIPGLSQSLYPRRDRFGEPIPNGAPLQSYANDRTVARMEALNMGVAAIEKRIQGVDLTPGQYDDFARIAGRLSKTLIDQTVRIPGFDRLPPGVQIDMMRRDITRARQVAEGQVMLSSVHTDNDIMAKAIANKREWFSEGKKLH